jgi:filamentous hemagglutinin
VISIELGPEMDAFFDGLIDPIGLAAISPTLAVVGSAAATTLATASTALVAGAASQLISTGNLNLGQDLEQAGVAGLTAGLGQGLMGSTGINNLGNGITQANAGITLANIGNTLENIGGQALIGAATQTAIEGGSFGTALIDSAAADAASVGANAIGDEAKTLTNVLGPMGGELADIGLHSALGCAASAAEGTGCAGGAIGAASSAAFSPDLVNATDPSAAPLDSDQQALLAGVATLLGGGLAGLAGANVNGGATAAQNEALNNADQHQGQSGILSALANTVYTLAPWLPGNPMAQAVGQTTSSTFWGLVSKIQAGYGGQTPPADASNQLSDGGNGGGNTPPTAGAVVTPTPCFAGPGLCGVTVTPVVTPGTPILASGSSGNDGSDGNTTITRPTFQQSEFDVGTDLGDGYTPQVSYLNGEVVPYGTPGSVRPDFVATDGTASFEVKNYNIATNSTGLVNNVAQQAIQRATNLPDGMQQQVVIDIRGQTVTPQQEIAIQQAIALKSNGIINPSSILFKTQ